MKHHLIGAAVIAAATRSDSGSSPANAAIPVAQSATTTTPAIAAIAWVLDAFLLAVSTKRRVIFISCDAHWPCNICADASRKRRTPRLAWHPRLPPIRFR